MGHEITIRAIPICSAMRVLCLSVIQVCQEFTWDDSLHDAIILSKVGECEIKSYIFIGSCRIHERDLYYQRGHQIKQEL